MTHCGERLLLALIAGYTLFYSVLCWRRFTTFHAQIDMSYYLRLVWGLGHGHYDLPLVRAPHVLGLHLEPIVLPLALLGRLGLSLPRPGKGVKGCSMRSTRSGRQRSSQRSSWRKAP